VLFHRLYKHAAVIPNRIQRYNSYWQGWWAPLTFGGIMDVLRCPLRTNCLAMTFYIGGNECSREGFQTLSIQECIACCDSRSKVEAIRDAYMDA
jgi:hypothetical protein